MVSSTERRKLVQLFEVETVDAWRTLAKCAAGLAVVTLIAVVGASEDAGRGGNVAKTVAPAAAQITLEDHEDGFDPLPQAIHATGAQQHRKQVSEPRRSRFECRSDGQSYARETVQPANRLSTTFR